MSPYVDIHTHNDAPRSVIAVRSHRLGMGESLPPVPFSAGVHPWDAGRVDLDVSYGELESMNIIAVGEIGLDFLKGDKVLQTEALEKQLSIAEKRRLPVILHCVKAFETMMSILAVYRLKGVVFHGYTGSPEQTGRLVKSGYYVSAGTTSLSSAKTTRSLQAMPPERLFLETDGKHIGIENIYAKASEVLQVPLPELRKCIYNNYTTLFAKMI